MLRSRQPRFDIPDLVHHVIVRGIKGDKVFRMMVTGKTLCGDFATCSKKRELFATHDFNSKPFSSIAATLKNPSFKLYAPLVYRVCCYFQPTISS